MTPIATVLRELMAAGLSGDALVDAIARVEASLSSVPTPGDQAAEKRRAWDRERKRAVRASAKSGGNPPDPADSTGVPSETKGFPGPLPKTQLTSDPPSPPMGAHGSTESGSLALAKPNGFARFWEAYPAKVGKRAAETAYDRAVGRIAEPDPSAVILAGVDRAKRSRKWREGIIPNPATWLNQDRWLDEPEGPFRPPPSAPVTFTSEQHAEHVRHYADTGEWREAWGPRPPPEVGSSTLPFPTSRSAA